MIPLTTTLVMIALSSDLVNTQNVRTMCMPTQVQCANGDCIPERRVCDGIQDCFDDAVSDENEQACPGLPMNCRGQKRRCRNTNICIDPGDMCDGYDDCGDMSDENSKYCLSQECAPLYIRCNGTGRCIPDIRQCDGSEDCADGSDEGASCGLVDDTCPGAYSFRCDWGLCITREYICDGEDDCLDNSDEDARHNCENQTCSEFTCVSNRGTNRLECIPYAWVCDGEVHCAKAEDETPPNCNISLASCNKNEFRCANGHCVDDSDTCDSVNDCIDNSDESNDHCQDTDPCDAGYFRCGDAKCIENDLKCDGNNDCSDGSDETKCVRVQKECNETEFRCHNGQCIPLSDVCNQVRDCDDRSDESKSCGNNECDNAVVRICQHVCVELPIGYECRCNPGYTLNVNNNRSCVDINECSEESYLAANCTQKCQNTPGGFKCICDARFKLLEDGMTCELLDQNNANPWILLANVYYIRSISADDSEEKLIAQGFGGVWEVDYDPVEQMIYVLDSHESTIYRFKYFENATVTNPYGMEKILTPSDFYAFEIQSIAVDWVARKLYFLSRQEKSLFVCELNGTSCTILLDGFIFEPGSVAISPETGYAFISNWDLVPYIGRVGLDGSNFTKIVESNLVWPNAIAVDHLADRIYWNDIYSGHVCSVYLDGSGFRRLRLNVANIYSVAVLNRYVYWTDRESNGLYRANKMTGVNQTLLATTVQIPYTIKAIHDLHQPPMKNPCSTNNGHCSHLCLLQPGGQSFKCACPYRMVLSGDQKTCEANCSPDEIQCGSPNTKCVQKRHICDGKPDCDTGEDEPPTCPDRICALDQFQCDDGGCIGLSYLCDGIDRCRDNFDELDTRCACNPWEFKCKNQAKCISARFTCDGDADCYDLSDEADELCQKTQCLEEEFRCSNGRCIPTAWKCDFENDCGDKSDEPAACVNTTCPNDWRKCRSSYRCVPDWYVCDGTDDCRDNSDEEDCKSVESCIPVDQTCDGYNDCGDNGDESDELCGGVTKRSCSESEFRCQDDACIRDTTVCDGTSDCTDGDDEVNCEDHQCVIGKRKCTVNDLCIGEELFCDRKIDCPKATDESACVEADYKRQCHGDEHRCRNGVCLSLIDMCDGYDDCEDATEQLGGSDETNEECMFLCANGIKKIPLLDTCNYNDDCGDSSDEAGCQFGYLQCGTDNGRCEGTCTPLRFGSRYICTCPEGHRVDELGNGKTCIGQSAELYLGSGNGIIVYSIDNEESLINASITKVIGGKVIDMDYDPVHQHIYWISKYSTGGALYRSQRFSLSNTNEIQRLPFDFGTLEPLSMAVDFVGENIYIGAAENGSGAADGALFVVSLTGQNKKLIIRRGSETPNSIALDHNLGLMYVAWSGRTLGAIFKSNMDGSNRMQLVGGKDVVNPTSLAIDYYKRHRIYWCDPQRNVIESILPNGENRILIAQNVYRPLRLDLFENLIYFSTEDTKEVYAVSKFANSIKQPEKPQLLHTSKRDVTTISVYQEYKYNVTLAKQEFNPCFSLNCSSLCLTSSGDESVTAMCSCSDDSDPLAAAGMCSVSPATDFPQPRICTTNCTGGTCWIGKDGGEMCNNMDSILTNQ